MQRKRDELRVARWIESLLTVLMLVAPAAAVDIIDDPMQIDERAAQLLLTSNSLCWEMHRYHQQQPEYRQAYRQAKEIWSRSGELRDALRAGPIETEVLTLRMTEMNDLFSQLEKTVTKWGNGDRSSIDRNAGVEQRTIVTPGAEIEIPIIGLRVGGPQVVVTDEGPPQLERRRLHPNSRGSKRSLQRELFGTKVALRYLLEDSGVAAELTPPEPGAENASGPEPSPLSPPPTKTPSAR
ncbi:MAG: hypothetical protein ACKV0T_14065 [Planctomycetales bacterium]